MNKKLILLPILIIGGAILLGGASAFIFVDNSTVEAIETDEFQDDVELVQNSEPKKEGRVINIEIHDGVGSSDNIN